MCLFECVCSFCVCKYFCLDECVWLCLFKCIFVYLYVCIYVLVCVYKYNYFSFSMSLSKRLFILLYFCILVYIQVLVFSVFLINIFSVYTMLIVILIIWVCLFFKSFCFCILFWMSRIVSIFFTWCWMCLIVYTYWLRWMWQSLFSISY